MFQPTTYSYSKAEVGKLHVSLNYFVYSGPEQFYSPLWKHISTASGSQTTTAEYPGHPLASIIQPFL